jgi:hypothetical protein
MDIIYAITIAVIIAIVGVIVTALSHTEGKPSLGPAYASMGGSSRYWALTLTSVAAHTAIYHLAPVWLSALFITLAVVGLAFNAWWSSQIRKSQKRVAEIFEQAKADARRKAALEEIAVRRAKLAEARSALEKGMVERAQRLANEAR